MLFEPAFARDAGPQAEEADLLEAMGVAIDDALDPLALGVGPEPPIEVEAQRMRIQFDPGAGFGTGVDDGALVHLVGFAFQQQSAGQVAQDMHERIARRPDEALRGFRLTLGEALVNAGDHDVQFGQEIVRQIQRPVLENVHLDASEQAERRAFVGHALVDGADFQDFLSQASRVKAVGLERGLRVVGYGPVGQAQLVHRTGDFFRRLMPVAPG